MTDHAHPVHGFRIGPLMLAWQLRTIEEVENRRLFVRPKEPVEGIRALALRISPRYWLAIGRPGT